MENGTPQDIEVTVTFLEMQAPPAVSPPVPYNRQVALLKTKDIPLHFYRYLMDRVGRKWHWVNVLRLDDDELSAGIHREDRDIRCSISTAGQRVSSISSRICRKKWNSLISA